MATSTNSRAAVRPKLVSNGRTSGRRTTASVIDSTRTRRIVLEVAGAAMTLYFRASLDFRYLAIDGPLGLGKTDARRDDSARGSTRRWCSTTRENPFLADFYAGRAGAAFQAQLFFTLARHRQLLDLRQGDLFSQTTVCDFLFERDRIYAFMNLDDNELFIYQRLFDLLAARSVAPDVVVYLQAPTDALKRRLRDRARDEDDDDAPLPTRSTWRS